MLDRMLKSRSHEFLNVLSSVHVNLLTVSACFLRSSMSTLSFDIVFAFDSKKVRRLFSSLA